MVKEDSTTRGISIMEQRPLYQPTVVPMFVVLGMLDEYLGRTIMEGGEVVETFYPHERALVDQFTEHLRKASKTYEIAADIHLDEGPHGHISVRSRALTHMVDAFYLGDLSDLAHGELPHRQECIRWTGSAARAGEKEFRRTLSASLDRRAFPAMVGGFRFRPEQADPRFSYLLGVYHRYGKATGFRFANSCEKAALVVSFLIELGCEQITHRMFFKGVPGTNVIEFEPTDDLRLFFGIEDGGSNKPPME